ncbi:MAG: putative endonuclease SmrA [Pseudomonadota bacterium]|jgi:DNA-nicking Smr family endonuclease
MPGMKAQSLADLAAIQRHLRERAAAEAAERQAALMRAAQAQRERELFARTVGAVRPIAVSERLFHAPPAPSPQPIQRQADEQRVMQEALSDEFDVETLLHTDEHLSFARPGVAASVVRKLREGHWSIQRHIDLHGLRTDEAREALGQFLREAHQQGVRCVRVVHGKGLGSPGRTPVLKGRVLRWLVQKHEVMVFVQARPAQGGAGALLVLLSGG